MKCPYDPKHTQFSHGECMECICEVQERDQAYDEPGCGIHCVCPSCSPGFDHSDVGYALGVNYQDSDE